MDIFQYSSYKLYSLLYCTFPVELAHVRHELGAIGLEGKAGIQAWNPSELKVSKREKYFKLYYYHRHRCRLQVGEPSAWAQLPSTQLLRTCRQCF